VRKAGQTCARVDKVAAPLRLALRVAPPGLCLFLLASSLAGQQNPPPVYSDITASSKVTFLNASSHTSQKYLLESMVGGVAMFDYDQDGYLDLYFVNGAALDDPMPKGKRPDKTDPRYWNRLYRNLYRDKGDLIFEDVTEQAGVKGENFGQGVAAADYDNDGFPDLFLASFGGNHLYRNRGDGTFEDVTRKAGVAGGGWSAGAGFIDYDKDGHLDLIVSRYVEYSFELNPYCGERKPGFRSYCHPKHFAPLSHLVYRNKGDGSFEDVSKASGFGAAPGKGLGIAFNDFDQDGWIDVLVANDSFPQQLFRNTGDGGFEELGLLSGVAYDEDGKTFAGMGTDFADYDNDGRPDVFINALAHQKYALFRNLGDLFEYVSGPSGVSGISALHSGWGAKFFDYDNDGRKDLFVAQGHVMDNIELTQPDISYEEPLVLMRNTGERFVDVSGSSGAPFQVRRTARGAAVGDLDNDGFLDIAINCNDQPAVVLRNEGASRQGSGKQDRTEKIGGNNWLIVNTAGTRGNRDGIGARIRLVLDTGDRNSRDEDSAGEDSEREDSENDDLRNDDLQNDDLQNEQFAFVSTAGSYLSSGDKRVHFGLGDAKQVKLLEVTWPSGQVQTLENVTANQILNVEEPNGE